MQHTFNTSQRTALNTVIDHMIALLEPEAVYCFGMHQATNKDYNAFRCSSEKQQHIHFYLLVITKNNDSNTTADVSDIIKIKSESSIRTTLLIHAPHVVLYPKGSQKHFFEWMTANAKLVYNSKGVRLCRPDVYCRRPDKGEPTRLQHRASAGLSAFFQGRAGSILIICLNLPCSFYLIMKLSF